MIDMKTRNEVISDKGILDSQSRIEYEKRLSLPYVKKGEMRSFMDQLLQGSGSELEKKFWRTISSSRLGFDLYSWIAGEDMCEDIQLEYKLPGIISRGRECKANMDVVVETKSDIWFIESKFTETVDNSHYSETLPGAYWESLDENGEWVISGEGDWYHNAKGEMCKYALKKRFRGHNDVALLFKKFCEDISGESKGIKDSIDWFDAKQETCHLFGIIMFILEQKPKQKVHFSNIVYNFNPEIENRSQFANLFIRKAQDLVDSIVGKDRFEYSTCFIQDVLGKYGNKIAYGTNESIREIISKNYPISM